MKKLLSILVFLSILLVACTEPAQEPNVILDGYTVNDRTITATFKLKEEPETESVLTEIVTSAAFQLYDQYKTSYGTTTYTLYITVTLNNSETANLYGTIAFKINESLVKPGLSLVESNLSLPE